METSRRNFITGVALSIGSALTPIGALAFEAAMSLSVDKQGRIRGSSFSKHQLLTVEQLVDTIIPTTETPGAAAANVHNFIDYLLSHFFNTKEKEEFLNGLAKLDIQAKGFHKLSEEEQIDFLNTIDRNRYSHPFYLTLKELTVIGYYTSEIGASQELNFSSVPGPYKEMPLSELGKAWS